MNFLLTLFFTFIFVVLIFLVFIRVGTPVYHLDKQNLVTLLTLVVEGRATENDWQVFLGMPIRHNEQLEEIRRRCYDISEHEYIGGSGYLLTETGIEDVNKLLTELIGGEE
ncbi:hypothetical protein LCGC14_1977350 [marine sediment metagenome]|uniref:Uncharacterized protein n=1 Tax=marine sediment metagenome TaxID=412755 RepID=A0A0F9HNA4_9ZZZZ|nr:hypothetical protein [Porticoccus sp.]